MDMYGLPPPPPDFFHFDDSLDFHTTNNTFSSATSSASNNNIFSSGNLPSNTCPSADITNDFYVHSEDAAELEWMSHFVDNSTFSDFTPPKVSSMVPIRPDSSFTASHTKLSGPPEPISRASGKTSPKDRACSFPALEGHQVSVRRCSHCASEKTPQWRTGPLGPKTLCNACGVRYKSGRLVPEYRPAASPTFVLTQHSNSHRKVLELRRQKEMLRMQQQQMQMHQRQQQQQQRPPGQNC